MSGLVPFVSDTLIFLSEQLKLIHSNLVNLLILSGDYEFMSEFHTFMSVLELFMSDATNLFIALSNPL